MVYFDEVEGSLIAAAAKVDDRTTSRVVTPNSLSLEGSKSC